MNKRQEQIIEFAQKNKSFKNKDLLIFFEYKYSRETITRDLSYLFREGILDKSGAGAYVVYSLAKIYKFLKEIDINKYFNKSYIERNVNERFNFDIFDILSNDIFTETEKEKLNNLQQKFTKNFSKYDSQTVINKEFERIMIDFSWKSSAIEGNTYSLLATEALIKNNIIGKGKTKEETQMILNHKDAFNEAIINKDRFKKLHYSDIEYIHSILIKKLGISKNIRKVAVGITGTKYKPLDNEYQIKENMKKMVYLVNKKKSFFEKSFLISILISYIQIFEDGNKRTARMISNAILIAHNSIPLSYRIINVEEYKKAVILFYETNNFSYFKQIFIDQFEDAVSNYFKYSLN
ncbi:Fic family protein [Patescibacteria group bacterium]|nr:Fic family protein [Patescibacteria group bacterium]